MLLADHEIAARIKDGTLGIEPFDASLIQPASMDLTMSAQIRTPEDRPMIDMRAVPAGHTREQRISSSGWLMEPGEFLLACTEQTVTLPPNLAARVEGRSSLGRLGLAVHITAGFIDPGFSGQITLEIANIGPWPLLLHKGMSIAQIGFIPMHATPRRLYGQANNHYQGQRGPTESRYRMGN